MRLFKLFTDSHKDKARLVYINEATIQDVYYVPEREVPIYAPDPNATEPIKIIKEGGYLVFDTAHDSYYWPGTLKMFKEKDASGGYANIEVF